MMEKLETVRLRIIACDKEVLQHAIEGNEKLSEYLNVTVPDTWTEFGVDAFKYSLAKLNSDENEMGWWSYFPVYKENNTLVGSGGFKGKPTINGEVEIGYEIAESFRNRGLATEMAKALIDYAFSKSEVQSIIAHTLGEENASTKVLTCNGFKKVDEIHDPEDGLIWKWQLKKSDGHP
jgi:[ribosomal protein S5]-alanine N-acetyltransferase